MGILLWDRVWYFDLINNAEMIGKVTGYWQGLCHDRSWGGSRNSHLFQILVFLLY